MSEDNKVTPEQDTTPVIPETTQDNNKGGQSDNTQTFSQADVDRIMAKTRKEGKSSAQKAFLEELEIDSLDSIKALLVDAKTRKEAEMSEAEKLQEKLVAMEASFNAEKVRAESLETARLEDKRDSGLLQLLSKAHDPQNVLILIKAQQADGVTALMADDGTFNSKEAETLVNEYASANAYLFTSGAPGSPSNAGGRIPQPDTAQAEKEIMKKFGRL